MMPIDPEEQLDNSQRGDLASMVHSNGFPVLKILMRALVEQFRVELDNAVEPSEVVRKHALSKASAMYYTLLLKRIDEEAMLVTNAPRKSDKPIDGGEGISMDDIESQVGHLPNLLGEPEPMIFEGDDPNIPQSPTLGGD